MLLFRQSQALDEEKLRPLLDAGIDRQLASLLLLRGIETPQQADEFLHPSLSQLHDPFLMPDMHLCVDRIKRAVNDGEKVVVYGDYDADGVTATAILLEAFQELGLKAGYYIPDRHEEGYGLNQKAVENLAREYDLMITVDCGISSPAEVALAKQMGMDVIVSDHHHLPETLPDCPILDPRIAGYPFAHLSGAGVALKIVQALGGMQLAEKRLDLAALGTVADIVSLTGENRAIVTEGLKRINRRPRPGIAALMETAGIAGRELGSTQIGFVLGPRINAGGRIGHSARSVEMLVTQDKQAALEIAATLEHHNQLRQAQETEILSGALRQIEDDAGFSDSRACIVSGEDWNSGVVGIVASRLMERYYRPAFVFARAGENYVCSARSIKGVHLFHLLEGMQDLFLRYGGHDFAAGLTLRAENLPLFRRRVEDALAQMDETLWIPRVEYDLPIRLQDLSVDYLRSVECLQPFGQGNQSPVYLLEEAQVLGASTMGQNGSHLRLSLQQDGVTMDAAAFKMGDRAAEASGRICAAVVPEINTWQGRTSVRLMVRQFSQSQNSFVDQARQNEQETFSKALPLLLGPLREGFKRHLEIDEDKVLSLLRSSLCGTLLLYVSAETAGRWVDRLTQEGLLQRVQLHNGRLQRQIPALNLLCGLGQIGPQSLMGYRNLVLLDGAPDRAVVDALLALAPGSLVFVPKAHDGLRPLLSGAQPNVESTRLLYRALRALQPRLERMHSLEELSRFTESACPLPLPKLYLSLRAMEDMELIELKVSPFALSMRPQPQDKKDFDQTALMRRIEKALSV